MTTKCFALLRSVIGQKSSRHFFNQSEVKLESLMTCSFAFSRAWRHLHAFVSSSDWFIPLLASVVVKVITLLLVLLMTLKYNPLKSISCKSPKRRSGLEKRNCSSNKTPGLYAPRLVSAPPHLISPFAILSRKSRSRTEASKGNWTSLVKCQPFVIKKGKIDFVKWDPGFENGSL